jgi:hypothetical protein
MKPGNGGMRIWTYNISVSVASNLAPLTKGILNSDAWAVVDLDDNREKYAHLENITWLGGFPEIRIPESFRDAEAVLFTAYPFDQEWIGKNGPIRVTSLKEQLQDPYVLRYAGDVNTTELQQEGIRYFPSQVASGHMGILPSAIGYDPIIRLQAGGLKSAEALVTGQHFYKNLPIVELL